MASSDIPSAPQAKEKLQCPIPYEELNREVISALKPHYFEGARVDITKGLNQKFALSHSLSMGPIEIATKSPETIKIPTSEYEFGANYFDPKLMLIGRVTTDGQLIANMKYDLSEKISIKANALLSDKPNMSNGVANFEYKGTDYRAQVQLGYGGLVAASYMQSVTPKLSLGGEVFWYDEHRKSGLGYAARYATDKMIATGQVTSTGLASLGYVHKVSDKLSLASEFVYDHSSKDVTASVGYDCKFNHQSSKRKDRFKWISGFLEEKLNVGLKLCLSAEVDHRKKDYKFGIGLKVGE